MLRKQKNLNVVDSFVFCCLIWCYLQFLAIAYARGQVEYQKDFITLRYLDINALFLVFSFIATWKLLSWNFIRSINVFNIHFPLKLLAVIWLSLVLTEVFVKSIPIVISNFYHHESLKTSQYDNVSGYLRTGDYDKFLSGKEMGLKIPYNDANRLKMILDDPNVRTILPTKLRSEVGVNNIINKGFVKDGLLPDVFNTANIQQNSTYYSSYSEKNEEMIKKELILYFDCKDVKTSWLKFQVAGKNVDRIRDMFTSESGEKCTTIIPKSIKNSKFSTLLVKAPKNQLIFKYSNFENFESWMAIKLPKEFGVLTLFIGTLLQISKCLLFISLFMMISFTLYYFSRTKSAKTFLHEV
jgi:hypothetical protein